MPGRKRAIFTGRIGDVSAVEGLADGEGRDVALRVQHGASQTLLMFAALKRLKRLATCLPARGEAVARWQGLVTSFTSPCALSWLPSPDARWSCERIGASSIGAYEGELARASVNRARSPALYKYLFFRK
jgi:hypothetical protein